MSDELFQFVSPYSFFLTEQRDVLVWELESSGRFSMSSAYHLVRPSIAVSSLHTLVWHSRIPTKISFFFWRLINRILPFPDVLRLIGFNLPSKCPHCEEEDTLIHCFLLCPWARHLWSFIEDILGLNLDFSADLHSFFGSIMTAQLAGIPRALLQLQPIFICRIIWKIRNKAIFEASPTSWPRARRLLSELLATVPAICPSSWPISSFSIGLPSRCISPASVNDGKLDKTAFAVHEKCLPSPESEERALFLCKRLGKELLSASTKAG